MRRRCSLWIGALCTLLMTACALPALRLPQPTAPDEVAAPPHAMSDELGRSERFVVYRPKAGDTLRSIAARYLGSEDRDWMIGEANNVVRAEPGQPLVVPLKPFNPIGVRSDEYQSVPILAYHRFGPVNGKMTVSPASFGAQLDWLARNGYRVVPLADLVGFLAGRQALPRRSVVITIDDGYESAYRYAFPLLRKYGVPATLFVYNDFIGAGDALSWAQLEEMVASRLVDVQAHSKTHRNLIERFAGETDERYRQSIEQEGRAPRELLEKRLPVRVQYFAYPFGDANEFVLEVLARQRYELGLTVTPGGNAFFDQPLMLHRTMIFGDYDLEAFRARLQTSKGYSPP